MKLIILLLTVSFMMCGCSTTQDLTQDTKERCPDHQVETLDLSLCEYE